MEQVTSSRWRRPARMLWGGRIFAMLAGAGGLLTCGGAMSTWVRVYPSTSSFSSGALLRPITGANPILPLIALGAGLAISVLAVTFVVTRRTERRAVLALVLISTGVVTALAFTDLRIGSPASLVPSDLRGNLPLCDLRSPRPCLNVYWPTETIVWGGWIAAFWGAWALIRVRPRPERPPIAEARGVTPVAVDHIPSVSEVPEPTAAWEASALRAEPRPAVRCRRPRGPRSDIRILGWLVGVVVGIAVLFLTGFMILFAMFYGDRDTPEIIDINEGPALFLTNDAPSAAAGFVFEANAAALEVPGLELLAFEWDTFWSGVPAGARELTPEIVKVDGPPLGEDGFRQSDPQDLVCHGDGCLGTYEARFRWPSDIDVGSVRIEWRVTANISYQSDPADGARVQARVERASGAEPPVRVFDGSFRLGADQQYVAKTTLVIRSETPIPLDGELAVEVDPDLSGASPVLLALFQEQGVPLRLQPSSSTPLAVPDRCRSGPCTFTLSLIGELPTRRTLPPADLTWGVTSRALAGPVTVSANEEAIPRVTERLVIGPVRVKGDEVASFGVTIHLPADALPDAEFGVARPVIQALLSFDAQEEAIEFPDDAKLELEVSFPSASGGVAMSFSTLRWEANLDYPESFVVPDRCVPEKECEVELIIGFAASDDDAQFEGAVEFVPTLDVFVAYPLTGNAPADVDLEMSLHAGR